MFYEEIIAQMDLVIKKLQQENASLKSKLPPSQLSGS